MARFSTLEITGNAQITGNLVINGTVTMAGLTLTGALVASTLEGAGGSITALNASNLGSGTVPLGRLHATLQALQGNSGSVDIHSVTLTLPSAPTWFDNTLNLSAVTNLDIPGGLDLATLTSARLVGRHAGTVGGLQEITLGAGMTFVSGALELHDRLEAIAANSGTLDLSGTGLIVPGGINLTDVTTGRLLGRHSGADGVLQEVTLGTGLVMVSGSIELAGQILAINANSGAVDLSGTSLTLPGGLALPATTTATTAVAGANSTAVATCEFVTTAVNNLVNGSSATLDTLAEIAAALGSDANFSTTITTALGNRLRLDAAQSLTTLQKTQGQQNLGVEIGVNVQAYSATLANIAGNTGTADISGMTDLLLPKTTRISETTGSAKGLWVRCTIAGVASEALIVVDFSDASYEGSLIEFRDTEGVVKAKVNQFGDIHGGFFVGNGTNLTNVPSPVSNTLYVDVAGNDVQGVRGNRTKPFLSVAGAMAAASAGDTILVGPGTFTTNAAVISGVHLRGSGMATKLTRPDASAVLCIGSSNTHVSDILIDGYVPIDFTGTTASNVTLTRVRTQNGIDCITLQGTVVNADVRCYSCDLESGYDWFAGSGTGTITCYGCRFYTDSAGGFVVGNQTVRVHGGSIHGWKPFALTHASAVLEVTGAQISVAEGGQVGTVTNGSLKIAHCSRTGSNNIAGLSQSGGTVELIGFKIDTSTNNATDPLIKTGGTMIVHGSVILIPHSSRNSIGAPVTPQNVINYGYWTKYAKHADITLQIVASENVSTSVV